MPCNDPPLCSRLSSVAHAYNKQCWSSRASAGAHRTLSKESLGAGCEGERQRRSGVEQKIVVFRDGGAALGSQWRGRARRFDASLLGKPIQCWAAQGKLSRAHPTLCRGLGNRRSGQTGFRARIRIHERWLALVGRTEPEGDVLTGHPRVLSFRPLGVRECRHGDGKQFSSVGQ